MDNEEYVLNILAESKLYLLLVENVENYVSLDELDFDYTYIKDRVREAILQIEMAEEEIARLY